MKPHIALRDGLWRVYRMSDVSAPWLVEALSWAWRRNDIIRRGW